MNTVEQVAKGQKLIGHSSEQILPWAFECFGVNGVTLASNFCVKDVIPIDILASRLLDHPDVFFLDTESLLHKTNHSVGAIASQYPMHLRHIRPLLNLQDEAELCGEVLFARNSEQVMSCMIRAFPTLALCPAPDRSNPAKIHARGHGRN